MRAHDGRDGIGTGRDGERGAALIIVMVTIMVAASIATSLLLVASARSKNLEGRRAMENAMAIAEAGLARGLNEANENKGTVPWPPLTTTVTLNTSPKNEVRDAEDTTKVAGRFLVTIRNGRDDGVDNNGSGAPDEQAEEDYVVVESTGYHGLVSNANPYKIRLRGIVQKQIATLNVPSALYIQDPTPDLDISSSKAFQVSGYDHNPDDLSVDTSKGVAAIATSGTFSGTAGDNKTDLGVLAKAAGDGTMTGKGTPIYTQNYVESPPLNIDTWVALAQKNKTHTVTSSLPSPQSLSDYSRFLYSEGDITMNGNDVGAGIWVVNGNLTLGGTVQFHGILIVTGNIKLGGGGKAYQVMGAVVCGGDATTDFENNGTTDIRYSSEAIRRAQSAGAKFTMVGWQQISAE